MKKFLSALLAIAFLLPAFAFADSYCVSFPTSGESKWTKRDNNIGVRFRYDFEIKNAKFFQTISGPPAAVGSEAVTNVIGYFVEHSPKFFATSGVLKGSGGTNRTVKDYAYYAYRTRDLCIYNPSPRFSPVKYSNLKDGPALPNIIHVRLDVKWGGDCGQVAINKDGRFTGTHKFEIYHRKGDLVNPFGCRRK